MEKQGRLGPSGVSCRGTNCDCARPPDGVGRYVVVELHIIVGFDAASSRSTRPISSNAPLQIVEESLYRTKLPVRNRSELTVWPGPLMPNRMLGNDWVSTEVAP